MSKQTKRRLQRDMDAHVVACIWRQIQHTPTREPYDREFSVNRPGKRIRTARMGVQ